MIERLLLLLLVTGVVLAAVTIRERRRPRRARMRPGITVITGPDCRLCPSLLLALDVAGADYTLIDVSMEASPAGIRSLPTVLVADDTGVVAIRRSGRSALSDLGAVLAVARAGSDLEESA